VYGTNGTLTGKTTLSLCFDQKYIVIEVQGELRVFNPQEIAVGLSDTVVIKDCQTPRKKKQNANAVQQSRTRQKQAATRPPVREQSCTACLCISHEVPQSEANRALKTQPFNQSYIRSAPHKTQNLHSSEPLT